MIRVLIVDDERQNRDLLEITLSLEGFELATAASGEEALRMVARHPPDLILLDVMMPGLNGYQVTAAIKADRATRHIPIILITGLDDQQSRTLGQAAGADEFLSRPIDRAELGERMATLLHRLDPAPAPIGPDLG